MSSGFKKILYKGIAAFSAAAIALTPAITSAYAADDENAFESESSVDIQNPESETGTNNEVQTEMNENPVETAPELNTDSDVLIDFADDQQDEQESEASQAEGTESDENSASKDIPEEEPLETDENMELESDDIVIHQFHYANPLFSDEEQKDPDEIIIEVEHEDGNSLKRQRSNADEPQTTIEGAGKIFKQALLNYESTVTIPVNIDVSVSEEDYERYASYYSKKPSEKDMRIIKLAAMILESASEHTGVPYEGDYILYHFLGFDYYLDQTVTGDKCLGNLTFENITQMADKSEQETVQNKMDEILSEIVNESMTDYEKISVVYQYICDHVSYDSAHKSDPNYLPQFTAYGAIMNGKAVCQGFCNSLYYMLNRVGIDTRIISGNPDEPHSWIIVKLGGKYYYCDPTWDEKIENPDLYKNFLKGKNTFLVSHTPDMEYRSEEFYADYNISDNDYIMSTITLSDSIVYLAPADTHQITAQVSDDMPVTFTSNDAAIATIDEKGVITAVAEGETDIIASTESGSAICHVIVSGEFTVTVEADDNVTKYISGGGKYKPDQVVKLNAIPETQNGYKFVRWEIEPAVTPLDSKTMQDYHIAFFMPKANINAVAIYEVITVNKLTLDKTNIRFEKVGDTSKITATVLPYNAENKKVTFKSSDTNVATVDEEGNVTATGFGTATITAEAGSLSATCSVTVQASEYVITVIGRTAAGTEKTQTKSVAVGDTMTISVPDVSSTGYEFVKWESSYTDIEYINGTKATDKKISFVMPAKDITLKATYTEITLESIKLNTTAINLTAGDTYTLTATVSPANARNKDVTYTSSNTSVATVNSNGLVTAVKAGSATITAQAGNLSAVCNLTVSAKTVSQQTTQKNPIVRIGATSVKMYAGKTYQLNATSQNAGTLSYSSSNSSVASVSASGLVTGVAEGTCTITVTGSNGGSASATITVVANPETETQKKQQGESGSLEGKKTYDPDMVLKMRAAAAKFKAAADKVRADALRKGYFTRDNSNKAAATKQQQSSTSGTQQVEARQTETREDNAVVTTFKSVVTKATGDSSNIAVWIAAILASMTGIILTIRSLKKKI